MNDKFQSTRSARSATEGRDQGRRLAHISIHALRKERDTLMRSRYPRHRHFNPRAPQGARPRLLVDCADPALISIHALRKERDVAFHVVDAVRHISIHALRKERDHLRVRRSHHTHNFNPRAPQGARQRLCLMQTTHRLFQSTRSAGSATMACISRD